MCHHLHDLTTCESNYRTFRHDLVGFSFNFKQEYLKNQHLFIFTNICLLEQV